jgi:hypothetical protein
MEATMWKTIQSRTRTQLAGFAALLVMALVIAAIAFAWEHVWPNQNHSYTIYQLYVTPASPWHAGQSISLQWWPSRAEMSGAPPRSVYCHYALYGPYPTQDAAHAHLVGPAFGSGAPLADSAPALALPADTAAPAPKPIAHALPDGLAPGYYIVAGSVDHGDTMSLGDTSSSWVVEVTA